MNTTKVQFIQEDAWVFPMFKDAFVKVSKDSMVWSYYEIVVFQEYLDKIGDALDYKTKLIEFPIVIEVSDEEFKYWTMMYELMGDTPEDPFNKYFYGKYMGTNGSISNWVDEVRSFRLKIMTMKEAETCLGLREKLEM